MDVPRNLSPNQRADMIRELYVSGFRLKQLAEMTDYQVIAIATCQRRKDNGTLVHHEDGLDVY